MTNAPWIEWNGGECPVSYHTQIVARFRDGIEARYTAGHLTAMGEPSTMHNDNWLHDGGDCDIVAYRIASDTTK